MNGWRLAMLSGAGLAGSCALIAVAAFRGRRALTYPSPSPVRRPASERASLLRIPAPGERQVFALHASAPPGAPTLAFFHGNGEQLSDVEPLLEALAARGLGVLAIEYPGYGLAAAFETSEQNVYADAQIALRHASAELGVPKSSLTLCGHSLGTGVATEMARRGLGARLAVLSR
jgi:alpha-beta hydrolase superfamily lysophospholipase